MKSTKIRRVGREWHSIERMPTVPFNSEEVVDEKRETTGELTIFAQGFQSTFSSKPEAIVRPLRRREPSDDDHPTPDLQELEAQIIEKLTKLESPQKAQRESIREFEKKPHFRWNQSRESKKSSRDVSDLMCVHFTSKWFKLCVGWGKWKNQYVENLLLFVLQLL